MGFSRKEYRSALPCPPPGDLPNSGSARDWGLPHCRWILYQLSYQGSPSTYIVTVYSAWSYVSSDIWMACFLSIFRLLFKCLPFHDVYQSNLFEITIPPSWPSFSHNIATVLHTILLTYLCFLFPQESKLHTHTHKKKTVTTTTTTYIFLFCSLW